MTCDECEKNAAKGCKYCIKCGACLDSSDKPEPKPVTADTFGPVISISTIVVALAILISAILLVANIGITLQWSEGLKWAPFLFIPVKILLPAINAQVLFVFFMIVILLCVAFLVYRSMPVTKGLSTVEAKNTPLYWLGLTFGATLVLETIINVVMTMVGISITVPGSIAKMTLPEAVWSMTEAAVWEEIAFRLILMGLPMAIVAAACKRKGFYKCLFGGFGVSRLSIALLLISSAIFAYAHLGGWGSWKLITVFIGGFVMGYLFLRFGLYASILFHFINDYVMVWSLTSDILSSYLMLAILLLGLLCLVPLLMRFYNGMKGLKDAPNVCFNHRS